MHHGYPFFAVGMALVLTAVGRWVGGRARRCSLPSQWLSVPPLPVVAPMLVLLVLLIVGIRVLRAQDDSGGRATGEFSVRGESLSTGTAC